MHKIGVIGDRDSVMGFLALGVSAFPVENSQQAEEIIKRLVAEDYAVIFVTENIGKDVMSVVEEYSTQALPAIVFIPNNKGSLGIGREKIRRIVEKAVGADILSGKEGD